MDADGFDGGIELGGSGCGELLDKGEGGAIEDGDFGCIGFDDGVGDAQADEGAHEVFDGGDALGLVADACASRVFVGEGLVNGAAGDVVDVCRDGVFFECEDDAGGVVLRGVVWFDGDGCWCCGEESGACDGGWVGDGSACEVHCFSLVSSLSVFLVVRMNWARLRIAPWFASAMRAGMAGMPA